MAYYFTCVFLKKEQVNLLVVLALVAAAIIQWAEMKGTDTRGQFQPIHTSGRQQENITMPKATHTVL